MRAEEAYTGTPFVVNREYARSFGDAWVILSAKYGADPLRLGFRIRNIKHDKNGKVSLPVE